MVVPALLQLFGEFNWWPRKFEVKWNSYKEYQMNKKDEEAIDKDVDNENAVTEPLLK